MDTQQRIDAILDRYREPAILLRRPYPPSALPDVRSRLGGLPDLPDGIEWPRAIVSNTPLHFLAQIDCAELPSGGPLPEVGMLLFFAKIDEEMLWDDAPAGESSRVIYDSSPVRPAGVRAPPPNLPAREGGWSTEQKTFGLDDADATMYPSWPLVAAMIASWPVHFALPPEDSKGLDFGDYEPARERALTGSILAATGVPPAPYRRPGWGDHGTVEDGYHVTRARMPAAAEPPFPQARIMIERIARAIAQAALQQNTEETAEIARVARAFAVEADVLGVANAPRPDQAREFASWLEHLIGKPGPLRHDAVSALEAGMQAAVTFAAASPDVANLIPVDYYADLEWAHSPARVQSTLRSTGFAHSYTTSFHQMLGHAPSSQDPRPVGSDRIVLLNLVSDEGVGFMFCDVGEAVFWIEPDDLAARRFDKVFATTCGG